MGCDSKSLIDVQGHRGCRGLLPENSLPAFEKAIQLGVNTLELDIAITKDNKVVVTHEPYMSRTICKKPNGSLISEAEDMQFNIYEMTHSEIKQFDCGTSTHPRFPDQKKVTVYKPLLCEVFQMVRSKNAKVNFNIEIKSKPDYYGTYTPFPKDYVTLVLNEIETANMGNRTNLQSFDIAILEEIKKQDKKMPVALLIDEDENITAKMKSLTFNPEIISPYFKLLDKSEVENLKATGCKVIPWTVNDKTDMQLMIDYEVDGIITDYPDELINLLNNL